MRMCVIWAAHTHLVGCRGVGQVYASDEPAVGGFAAGPQPVVKVISIWPEMEL